MLMFLDIKYAIRQLFKSPRFTAMTLFVLIGGLSISLFTFSFLYSTVYKPLSLPNGDSIKAVTILKNGNFDMLTANDFTQMKDELNTLAEFGIYQESTTRVSIEDSGKSYSSARVREGFFKFAGVEPILGRTINAEDTVVGANPVALISEEIWQSDYRGNNEIIGSTIILDGVVTEIVGVMPAEYRFPNTARLWTTLSDDVLKPEGNNSAWHRSYARVKSGVTITQAEQEMTQVLRQIHQENVKLYQIEPSDLQVKLMTFQMAQTGGEGSIVFSFLNAVALMILLLACINVGNLLLARTLDKQKETAIRSALGANSVRLVSQLMWEGVLIALLGGFLSVLLVAAALDYTNMALQSWIPSGGSFWWRYGMDGATLGMAVVFTLVTILLSSFLPAWRSANQDINTTLRDGTRGAQSKKAGRLSRLLVTTQVFLVAILMLIGSISAYIAHSFINIELGDDYSHVMSARFQIPTDKYPSEKQQLNLTQELIQQVKQHPSVVDVVTNNWAGTRKLYLDNKEYLRDTEVPTADVIQTIGPLATVGVNLTIGRNFNVRDTQQTRKVALISESMAKRYWPNESAIDKSFTLELGEEKHKMSVVGVVSNRMNPSTMFGKIDAADEIYISGQQFIASYQVFFYRVLPGTENADEVFYRAMFNTDRSIELTYQVQPAEQNRNKMRESMALLSNITFITGFFALLLALVGIYGLTANAVAQRTHEVGIRRAIGATDLSITLMFLKQGGKQLVIGLGLALLCFALMAMGFHQFTEQLFPVMSYYVLAISVALGLSIIVMIAIFMPTKRAIQMEPSVALRYE
ncbi:ABC transporter permease [Thalassotalea marina]|uniref:Permease n=1 Tax=Thalassotalea marina TaxID=1673741 RepID=A0A919BQJ8_9GAMM|nr:ABC transporter permease [Thalassotalea marina]GHG05472.1 hypothetical protein GCM10017161_38860 [Thalassotalea marina]